MAYGTVNADVIGTSVAGSNIGAGNASTMKNRIINGAMVIDQRAAGASVTTPTTGAFTYATCDRWAYFNSQANKFTMQQASTGGAVNGFVNDLGITSTSAYSVGAGDYFTLSQAIEGYNIADLNWGTSNAKTVTLSFQVYSSLTGTFGGSITNSANTRSYPFSYSIPVANTWTQISITITGDTTGTWLTTNGKGMIVLFGLGVGSTYSGTAGSWSANQYFSATGATSVVGTSGATFYITGVQLEVGSSATGFEYVNYQTSLANCQRYLPAFNSSSTNSTLCSAYSYSGAAIGGIIVFPVQTRVPPTGISVSSSSSITFYAVAAFVSSGVTFSSASVTSGSINVASTGLTSGQGGQLAFNTSGAQILFTGCEL
jgi:hypothetical protein